MLGRLLPVSHRRSDVCSRDGNPLQCGDWTESVEWGSPPEPENELQDGCGVQTSCHSAKRQRPFDLFFDGGSALSHLFDDQLTAARFQGDSLLMEGLRANESISEQIELFDVVRRRHSVRTRLLASAVRVDLRLVPDVAASFESLRSRLQVDVPIEAYVFQDASINAYVVRGREHIFVALSSAAVNGLSTEELDFVIGHELGHAIFKHVDMPAGFLLETVKLSPRERMLIRAWERAAELSGDRLGLLCCGSLDVAATAMFKTISGLVRHDVSVSATEFASQWELLEREVIMDGDSDFWQLSHPFPPLRVKAMMLFAEHVALSDRTVLQSISDVGAVDSAVQRLLAVMDPLARENETSRDPILSDFFLWGGMYIAWADGAIDEREVDKLRAIVASDRMARAMADGPPPADECLKQFQDCIASRRRKLKAGEMFRILQGLLEVAVADGEFDESEAAAITVLGKSMGLNDAACELFLSQNAPAD